jgi:alpha-tubulin suppressor-like RCC1 family protein
MTAFLRVPARVASVRALVIAAAALCLAASPAAAGSGRRGRGGARASIAHVRCHLEGRTRSFKRGASRCARTQPARSHAAAPPPAASSTSGGKGAGVPEAQGTSVHLPWQGGPEAGPVLDTSEAAALLPGPGLGGEPEPSAREVPGTAPFGGGEEAEEEAAEGAEAPSEASPASVTETAISRSLASFGANFYGELCVGWAGPPEQPQPTFTPVGPLSQVAASEGDDYFDVGGRLWACGTNAYGTAGIGVQGKSSETPVPVEIPQEVAQVSAHGWQAIALTRDGRVWTWGANAFGQIGNGKSTRGAESHELAYPTPAPVAGIEHAVYVQSGGPDDIAILANGDIYGWGGDFGGEFGMDSGEQLRPVKIADLSGRGIVKAVTGGFIRGGGDLYALAANGTLYAQGRNELGELGGPGGVVQLPAVKDVETAVESAYAVTRDGRLFAWGSDAAGQLGIGPAPETCLLHGFALPCSRHPVQVPLSGVSAVCAGQQYAAAIANGHVYTFGTDRYGSLGGVAAETLTPLPVPGLADVTATGITCGRFHVLVNYVGAAIPPVLQSEAGPGSVTLTWRSGTVVQPWDFQFRLARHGSRYPSILQAPPLARTYVLGGLTPGVRYLVSIKNPLWGRRFTSVTPTALPQP